MADEWQPIETAPKDGREFLVRMDGAVYAAKYCDGNPKRFAVFHHSVWEPTVHEYVKARRGGAEVTALYEVSRGPRTCEAHWSLYVAGWEFHPTHWMPLPEPPRG